MKHGAITALAMIACAAGVWKWVDHVQSSNAQARAERDRRCGQQQAEPVAPFKRSADCFTWIAPSSRG